jgi:phosphoribosylformylglycinamidine (FGAM) synthase-like amidotransferase family enzyme
MNSIQISDLNASDFEFMHQLTDEELLAINGGFSIGGAIDWVKDKAEKVYDVGKQVVAVATSPTTQKVINTIIDYFKKHPPIIR